LHDRNQRVREAAHEELAVCLGQLSDDGQLAARKIAEMPIGLYAAPEYLRARACRRNPTTSSRCKVC